MKLVQYYLLLIAFPAYTMNNPVTLPISCCLNSDFHSIKMGNTYSLGFSTRYEKKDHQTYPDFDWEIENLKEYKENLELLSIRLHPDTFFKNTLHKVWTFKALKRSDIILKVKKTDLKKDDKLKITTTKRIWVEIK